MVLPRLVAVGGICLLADVAVAEHVRILEMMDCSRATCGWRTVRINESVSGGRMSVEGIVKWRGLGTHAPSRVEIPLGDGALRVETGCAIDDGSKRGGSVEFRIWADDRIVATSGLVRAADGVRTLKADLRGARICVLEVTDGGDGHDCDHADWIETFFVYEDGKFPPNDVRSSSRQLGILTPKTADEPRINGGTVLGVRPSHPILWRLPVTGERPMELSAIGLPDGVAFDCQTQILTGTVERAGDYPIVFTAQNHYGQVSRTIVLKVGSLLAPLPPMGWNSWNCHSTSVNADKIRIAADAMVASGLADHGWQYVNIDDFWQNNREEGKHDATLSGEARRSDGTIAVNGRFSDMKGLVDYIHGKGLKAGIYSSPGPETCGGCTGSYGHEESDAKTYADWGFDFLKYDWCSYGKKAYGSGQWRFMYPYWIMGRALSEQKRDIVFSLCEYGCENVASWGNLVGGSCWRTTGDVFDTWASISGAIESQKRLFPYSKPGAWNDPDMLCVGKMCWNDYKGSRLAPNEQYTHISLWALLAAPLMIGCDLTQIDDFTYSLLSNDEVIAIDQDSLGAGAGCVDEGDGWEVWARPLSDGSIAAGLFNRSQNEQTVVIDMEKLGILCKWRVRDVWSQQDEGVFLGRYSHSVPGHATHLIRMSPCSCGRLRDGMSDIRDNAWKLLMKHDGGSK